MLAVAVVLLVQLILGLILQAAEQAENAAALMAGALVLQTGIFLVYFFVVLYRKKTTLFPVFEKHKSVNTKFKDKFNFKNIGLSAAAGILCLLAFMLFSFWAEVILELIGFNIQTPPHFGVASIILLGFAVIIFAPIAEEVVFRSLQSGLQQKVGATKAVLLAALAFAFIHLSPLQTVYQFALGVVCGLLALWTKSTMSAIAAHLVSNAVVFGLNFMPLEYALQRVVTYDTIPPSSYNIIRQAMMQNAGAAIGITIGALAMFGTGLFFLMRYIKKRGIKEKKEEVKEEIQGKEEGDTEQDAILKNEVSSSAPEQHTWIFYSFGIAICAAMWIVTLVNGIAG